jgi:hypothetical protein
MGNKQYGGAGSFVPAGSPAPDGRPEGYTPSRVPSSSGASLIPPSLRSHITGSVDLYVAPYESAGHHNASSVDQITSEFAELGVHHPRQRRESYTVRFCQWPRSHAHSLIPCNRVRIRRRRFGLLSLRLGILIPRAYMPRALIRTPRHHMNTRQLLRGTRPGSRRRRIQAMNRPIRPLRSHTDPGRGIAFPPHLPDSLL